MRRPGAGSDDRMPERRASDNSTQSNSDRYVSALDSHAVLWWRTAVSSLLHVAMHLVEGCTGLKEGLGVRCLIQ